MKTADKKEVMRLVDQLVTNACMWGEHGTKDYYIQIEGIKKDIELILNKIQYALKIGKIQKIIDGKI